MATHSSIIVWKVPWTEECGGLQSQGHKELDATDHTQHILIMLNLPIHEHWCVPIYLGL